MSRQAEGIPHYLFYNRYNEPLTGIELSIDYDQRLPLKLDSDKGNFIYAKYNGKTMYFSTKDSCESYILEHTEKHSVLVNFRKGKSDITDISSVQVLESGTWKTLIKEHLHDRIVYPYQCNKGPFKVRLRWKTDQSPNWKYDWLFVERSYYKIFEEKSEGDILLYNRYGKSYYPIQRNSFNISIDDPHFTFRNKTELNDSIKAVMKWYGIEITSLGYEKISLKNLEDRFSVNRALKKHFASCDMSPILSKRYKNDYVSNTIQVEFFGKVSDEEISKYLRSIGISTFYIRERKKEVSHPVDVSITFTDIIRPSFHRKLEKLYESTLIFSLQISVLGVAQPD